MGVVDGEYREICGILIVCSLRILILLLIMIGWMRSGCSVALRLAAFLLEYHV